MPVEIDFAGEGTSDEAIARRLILAVPAAPGRSYLRPLSGTGKQSLDGRLRGLNAGAAYGNPVLVLRDLDQDAACAGTLVARLLPERHPNLLLRICVREAEAWLLADAQAYARYSGLALGRIPRDPEHLVDPKQTILGWVAGGHARTLCRHVEDDRHRGVPDWASLGAWHAEFATERWDPDRAAMSGRVPSLTRALLRLRALPG